MEDRERVWFLRPLRDLEEHPMDLAVRAPYFPVAQTSPTGHRQAWVTTF